MTPRVLSHIANLHKFIPDTPHFTLIPERTPLFSYHFVTYFALGFACLIGMLELHEWYLRKRPSTTMQPAFRRIPFLIKCNNIFMSMLSLVMFVFGCIILSHTMHHVWSGEMMQPEWVVGGKCDVSDAPKQNSQFDSLHEVHSPQDASLSQLFCSSGFLVHNYLTQTRSYSPSQWQLLMYIYFLSKIWESWDLVLVILARRPRDWHFGVHHMTQFVGVFLGIMSGFSIGPLLFLLNSLLHGFMYAFFAGASGFFHVVRFLGVFQLMFGVVMSGMLLVKRFLFDSPCYGSAIGEVTSFALYALYSLLFVGGLIHSRRVQNEAVVKGKKKQD